MKNKEQPLSLQVHAFVLLVLCQHRSSFLDRTFRPGLFILSGSNARGVSGGAGVVSQVQPCSFARLLLGSIAIIRDSTRRNPPPTYLEQLVKTTTAVQRQFVGGLVRTAT